MADLQEVLNTLKEHRGAIEKNFGDISSNLTSLEARMTDMETKMQSRKVTVPGLEDEKQTFSFLKAINAIVSNDWSVAGFEKEVFDTTRKTMAAGAGTTGGYIVPSIYVAEIIELLRAKSIIYTMGATVLDGLTGSPVEIPKQTGGATAYWVGENQAITPSDLTLGQLNLTPKAVAAMVKLSNRLLRLSNPSAEAMVRRDIATVLALKMDLAALRGSGVSNEPLGIANTSGINTVAIGTNGGTFTYDHAEQMANELDVDNALTGNPGFVFHPTIKSKLKRIRIPQYSGDTGGEWVVLPMSDAKMADTLGWKFTTTTQIPVNLTKGASGSMSEVYFGNWQELLIGQWGGMEIMASTETSTAFETLQTWVRIVQEMDIALRHPESFCLCSDAYAG